MNSQSETFGEYTGFVIDNMRSNIIKYKTGEYNDKKILELLNNENYDFRSFGEGLMDLIKQKNPEVNDDEVLKYIKQSCKKNGVDINEIGSDNTLRNWLYKGMRAEKKQDTRRSLFALAFALNLTVEETVYLFEKVYLDRAFNYRNQNELICYYCLVNNKTWADVERIVDRVEALETNQDGHTIATNQLEKGFESIVTEEQLIQFIQNNRYNIFKYDNKNTNKSKTNRTAKKTLAEWIEIAKKEVVKEEIEQDQYGTADEFAGLHRNVDLLLFEKVLKDCQEHYGRDGRVLADDYSFKSEEEFERIKEEAVKEGKLKGFDIEKLRKGKRLEYRKLLRASDSERKIEIIREIFDKGIAPGTTNTSISYMYYTIIRQPLSKEDKKSVFSGARLCKEIKNRFPDLDTFTKDVGYEGLRKGIILLFSYVYWRELETQRIKDPAATKQYYVEMNEILNGCGFPILYCGNPYDWLFIYCTTMERPLITFRSILAESLGDEDEADDEE